MTLTEEKKIKILNESRIIVTEEEKKALDILEIDHEIDGHETAFKFIKAILDKDFIRELVIDVEDLPKRVNLNYKINLILDPTNFNISLNAQFEEMKKNQLSLLDKDNDFLKNMERIQNEYKKDRKLVGDFKFEARLSELKNKQTETLKFIVSGDVIREIEKLKIWGALHRMTLVLETI